MCRPSWKITITRIWAGTSHGGLNLYNPNTHTFQIFEHRDGDTGSLACNTIAKLFEDGQHRLWVGMRDGGLDLFDPRHETFRHFRNDPRIQTVWQNVVLSLENDDAGNLWIGTENGGISILEPDLKTFRAYAHDDIDNTSLTNNSIYSFYP